MRKTLIGKTLLLLVLAVVCVAIAWGTRLLVNSSQQDQKQPSPDTDGEEVAAWVSVDDFNTPIAVFDTVFWDPRDTESLRALIRNSSEFEGKSILEIGTGSGLLALCCLEAGAAKVVATDVNPQAVKNARFNARRLAFDDRLEVRAVPLDDRGAYSVIGDSEEFDLIVSNPPWENQIPQTIGEFALYDPDFELLASLLEGLEAHLSADGRALLAYGCVSAVETLMQLAERHRLDVRVLDDRKLDDLPEVFLPGMLLEVTPRGDGPVIRPINTGGESQ